MTALPGEPMGVAGALADPCQDAGGDFDFDGVCKNVDNCASVANADQADPEGDGVGTACDNCPGVANDDQTDTDFDAQGDACDTDDDNDGCKDGVDEAPLDPEEKIGHFIAPFCNPSGGDEYGF